MLIALQVEWSPFEPNRIACAAAQHFGIVGNGRLYIVDCLPNDMRIIGQFDTKDGLYDCSWSETHDRLIIAGSGDGSVKMWDISMPGRPARSWEEHSKEVAIIYNILILNISQHRKFCNQSCHRAFM